MEDREPKCEACGVILSHDDLGDFCPNIDNCLIAKVEAVRRRHSRDSVTREEDSSHTFSSQSPPRRTHEELIASTWPPPLNEPMREDEFETNEDEYPPDEQPTKEEVPYVRTESGIRPRQSLMPRAPSERKQAK